MMTCKNCGKENRDGAAFCHTCGGSLTASYSAFGTGSEGQPAAQNTDAASQTPQNNAGNTAPPYGYYGNYPPPNAPHPPYAARKNSRVLPFLTIVFAVNAYLCTKFSTPYTVILAFLFGLTSLILGIIALAYNPSRNPRTPLAAIAFAIGISIFIFSLNYVLYIAEVAAYLF